MKKPLIIFSFLLLTISGYSQTWINYTTDGYIQKIAVDENTIYGATRGGLSRTSLDATEAYVFTRANTDLPHDHWATSVFTLPGGKILVSYFDQTYWLDGYTLTPTDFPRIFDIVIDKNDNVWMNAGPSILKYDGVTTTEFNTSNSPLVSEFIEDMAINTGGDSIWIATTAGLNLIEVKSPLVWHTYDESTGMPSQRAGAIEVDSKGRVWITAENIINPDPESFLEGYIIYIYENNAWSEVSITDVNDFQRDDKGGVWAGTIYGLRYFNANKTQIISPNFPSGNIQCITPYAGGLLLGINDIGISYFDGTAASFLPSSNSGLPHPYIEKILEANDGAVWVATSLAGLAKFKNNVWTVYNPLNSGLPYTDVTDIKLDSEGNIWVSTFGEGLVKFDGTNWTEYPETDGSIHQFEFDGLGNIWITYNFGKVAKFNPLTSDYTQFNQFGTSSVYDLAIAQNGHIWFAVFEGGLFEYDGTNFINHTSNLPNNLVRKVEVAPDGKIWVGMQENGVFVFDGSIWKSYNTNNSPIQDNSIQTFKFFDDGTWIGTRDGAAFLSNSGNWKTLTFEESRLPGRTVNDITKLLCGDIWFSTFDGIGILKAEIPTTIASPENFNDNFMTISPNPADNFMTLNFKIPGNYQVKMLNLTGESVLQKNIGQTDNYSLNISELNPGVYFCNVTMGDISKTQKIIIR